MTAQKIEDLQSSGVTPMQPVQSNGQSFPGSILEARGRRTRELP
jgi:hypothetical protein